MKRRLAAAALALLLALGLTACGEKGPQPFEAEKTAGALIEAGATRLRPILMTTLTTIVAMIPMAAGYGDSGEMMQGLGLVDVGGLVASTILSLLMLPVYYSIMNRKKKREPNYD